MTNLSDVEQYRKLLEKYGNCRIAFQETYFRIFIEDYHLHPKISPMVSYSTAVIDISNFKDIPRRIIHLRSHSTFHKGRYCKEGCEFYSD